MNMKKILPIIIVALFMVMAAPAYAYEITGTLSTGVAPATPTGLTTSSPVQGDTSITIKWNPVANISGYDLYRITGTAPSVFVASTTSTSYSDTGLSDGSYSYQVESYLGTLTSAKSLPSTPVTIDTTAPSTGGGGGGGGGGSYTPPTTQPTLAQADFNGDGVVNILDFNTLIIHWGMTSGATKADGDANGDGKVDIFDFNILITHWTN